MEIYFGILIPILGLLFGSFLNVCIYRIPKKESIVVGSSHCMNCNKKIKWYDLFPLFSYIFLLGKCRNCKTKISIRYPLIETLNCILYFIIYLMYGLSLQTILYCAMASAFIVISMIDFDTKEIPNGLHIFLLCLSPLSFIINDMPFWHKLIGFVAASGILLILAVFTNGFGGGDIKLMAVCGLLIGYKNILLGLFIGIILGGIVGSLILIFKKQKEKRPEMAFGPYLCIGTLIAALYGNQIITWYLTLINR